MGSCNATYISFGNVLLASPTQTIHSLHTGTGDEYKEQRKNTTHNTYTQYQHKIIRSITRKHKNALY
jgi:hypothetical protein